MSDIDFSLIPHGLVLSENKLTSVADLSHSIELEHLDTSSNHITQVYWRNLPPALTWFYLANNQLTTVGDVSQCTQLNVLSVHSNHINHIEWRNLHPELTLLYLVNNKLTTVDLMHCTQLERLDLCHNPTLHSVYSLLNTRFDLVVGYFW